jgi:hypothetical protein
VNFVLYVSMMLASESDDVTLLQAVTVAISCIRTIAPDQTPHLLRFLLLSATPVNAGRIISQIREQLKFVGVVDPRAARSKKLKGKASANSTDGAILDTLRSGLRFKNVNCFNLQLILQHSTADWGSSPLKLFEIIFATMFKVHLGCVLL